MESNFLSYILLDYFLKLCVICYVYILKKWWKNLTLKKYIYNSRALKKAQYMCGYRLVVRTSGFHPVNRSSILRSRAIFLSRSREVVSRQAHNLEVVRSIRTSATKKKCKVESRIYLYLILCTFFSKELCQCSSVG